ncbi:hypothetical protein [Streptomyces sp. CB02115]|nr:hypothetical protein [Streptomyces sp. CB02115]
MVHAVRAAADGYGALDDGQQAQVPADDVLADRCWTPWRTRF